MPRTTEELRTATAAALTLCLGPHADPESDSDAEPVEEPTDLNVRREEGIQRAASSYQHRPRFKKRS